MVNDTLELFDAQRAFEALRMTDAEVRYIREFYAPPLSRHYLDSLMYETPWRQEKISVWGKQHLQPRLTAWYGDPGTDYAYSGIVLATQSWTPTLRRIKSDIEAATGYCFNSVLLNLYRNEFDSVGWHSDDEPELGNAPVIASLSLGETRTFKFRHKTSSAQKPVSIALTDGCLLLMAGTTQRYWQHGIDKERRHKGPRINLTFRSIANKGRP
jgi:alkylated DNA repair dioxygenase AlkB